MTWLAIITNRWAQLAAGILFALAFGFQAGHHQKTLEDASAALSEAKRAVQTVAKQSAATSTVDQHATQAIAAVQQRTVTLVQKVPVYVTRKADDQCIVSRGAVSLLDAAALDTVPATPGGVQGSGSGVGDPDADSGVKLSAVVQADIVNAGNYHQLAERLRAWDEWYDAQAKVAK